MESSRMQLMAAVSAGAAAGVVAGYWLAHQATKAPKLPGPSKLVETLTFTNTLAKQPLYWVFLGDQIANLEHLQNVLGGRFTPDMIPHIAYAVRLKRSAGFCRAWSKAGYRLIGEQTVTCVFPTAARRTEEYKGTVFDHVDQTKLDPSFEKHMEVAPAEMAHDLVGVLIPIFVDFPVAHGHFEMVKQEDVDWLAWTECPDLGEIRVHCFDFRGEKEGETGWSNRRATEQWPILQTHVDLLVEAALHAHRDASHSFAKEWAESIHWWSSHWLNDRPYARRPWVSTPNALPIDAVLKAHPPKPRNKFHCRAHAITSDEAVATPLPAAVAAAEADAEAAAEEECKLRAVAPLVSTVVTPQRVAKNFVVGYGSIIQTASRAASDKSALDAAPVRIAAEFGYVREWNFQASTSQICALGLRRVLEGEPRCSFNGVLFPAPHDMSAFDARENGYRRVRVPNEMVQLLSWQRLPADATVYVYVPYAPAVVAKYGNDSATGLPVCSGAQPPPQLLPSEKAGLGLSPASIKYPILQTYIDVCLTGCLEHGEDFAREFIQTTFLWTPFWLNERELSRRPWVHQKQYVAVDRLLQELVPQYFAHRKLSSEYAVLFHHDE